MRVKFLFPKWMTDQEYHYWKQMYNENFYEFFFGQYQHYDKIVYFHPTECTRLIEDPIFFNNLENRCKENNTELEVVIQNHEKENPKSVINWREYWQFFGYYNYIKYHTKPDIGNFDKLFVCLNRRVRYDRSKLMDELARVNLLKDSYYSWNKVERSDNHIPFKPYNFKYFDNEFKQLDNLYDNSLGIPDLQEGYSILGDWYTKGFINVISDTTTNDIMYISEKSHFATLHRKPYILLGCAGSHARLKELGYQLYDEIFDYSFDSCSNVEDRINGIVENLLRLQGQDYNKLYLKIIDKIEYNRNKIFANVKNRNLVPTQFWEYEKYLETDHDKKCYNFYKEHVEFCLNGNS